MPRPRRRPSHMARGRHPCRWRGAAPARCRARTAASGRAVPLQRQRVRRIHVRRVQGGPRAGQHELSLHGRRAAVPVGQRRRRRRRLPWHLRRHDRGNPGPAPQGAPVVLGGRRQRPVPRLGDAVRGGGRRRGRPRPAGLGPDRRRPDHAVHRRHDRHAQGRDVATGRSRREAHRHPRQPARPGRHRRGTSVHVHRTRADLPPGLPADARHRQLPVPVDAVAGRQHRDAVRPSLRPCRTARHHRAGRRHEHLDRRRRVRASRSCGHSTPNPNAGTSRAWSRSCRRA